MTLYTDDGMLLPEIADTLCEIDNVGIAHGMTVLCNILEMRLSIDTPRISPFKVTAAGLSGKSADVDSLGILMEFKGVMSGLALYIINIDIVSEALEREFKSVIPESEFLSDKAAFNEIAKTAKKVADAYIKAIGAYTDSVIKLSPIMIELDTVKSLIEYPLNIFSQENTKALIISTHFSMMPNDGGSLRKAGRMILMPDEKCIEPLMKSLIKPDWEIWAQYET